MYEIVGSKKRVYFLEPIESTQQTHSFTNVLRDIMYAFWEYNFICVEA